MNLVILQKRVFVLYPSDMALLYLTVRLHSINRIVEIVQLPKFRLYTLKRSAQDTTFNT